MQNKHLKSDYAFILFYNTRDQLPMTAIKMPPPLSSCSSMLVGCLEQRRERPFDALLLCEISSTDAFVETIGLMHFGAIKLEANDAMFTAKTSGFLHQHASNALRAILIDDI